MVRHEYDDRRSHSEDTSGHSTSVVKWTNHNRPHDDHRAAVTHEPRDCTDRENRAPVTEQGVRLLVLDLTRTTVV